MATNDEQQRAHQTPEPPQADPAPFTTADVDETPPVVKYGAAVLLGLAFGVGCYIWVDGGVPSSDRTGNIAMATAGTQNYYGTVNTDGIIPDAFRAAFEPSLDPAGTAAGNFLRETATSESVEPTAPADLYIGNDLNGHDALASAQNDDVVAVAPTDEDVVYLFAYDSAAVPETPELTAIAERAKSNGLSLDVRAYTDEHGRAVYNQRLSERRAKAIGQYLIAHGVPAAKIKVHGMGVTHDFANDAQDRRATVHVLN